MVLTSRKPRKGFTVVPFAEETGGKIFRSNGKHPGDVRIALIAGPLDSEECESKRWDARCAQGHKHGSYVHVDSFQITGGRTTPGKHPVAPAAATFQNVSPLKPVVYPLLPYRHASASAMS